ncbi:hypothetical protein D1872_223050 [compost metagenome]
MEGGDSEKKEVGSALRSGRRKANVSFSDRSRPPAFLLFFPLTTRICRFIKSDVYSFIQRQFRDEYNNSRSTIIKIISRLLIIQLWILIVWMFPRGKDNHTGAPIAIKLRPSLFSMKLKMKGWFLIYNYPPN